MKTKKTKEEAATPQAKGNVKLKNLKLHKETLQDLSPSDGDMQKVVGGSFDTVQRKSLPGIT